MGGAPQTRSGPGSRRGRGLAGGVGVGSEGCGAAGGGAKRGGALPPAGGEAGAPRLVTRYRLGREGYIRFLLGSTSIADLLRRRRLFNVLLRSDLEAIALLRTQADATKAARDELLAAHVEQDQSVNAEAERRASLQEKIDQQRTLLASIQREPAVHEEAARELEDAEKQLSRKLAEIRSSHPALKAPEILLKSSIRRARGRLPFPVDQGRIEVRFGRAVAPRFGTVTLQTGIDVRAPGGTPVHAVWDGKVAHAGWFRGFGNLLIVDHGHGMFSLMAHLDQLRKALGDGVRAGEEVGTVGETGSLKGPYLYFELRDGQKPLDPEQWLSRRHRGPPLLAGAQGGAAEWRGSPWSARAPCWAASSRSASHTPRAVRR